MQNSSSFLAAFNEIEKTLKTSLPNTHGYRPFASMISDLKRTNAVVRKYETDLREFADLRNAIVHERTDPNYVIAEPHESTVRKIQFILGELTNPERIYPKFRRSVETLSLETSVGQALSLIRDFAYSQFPVYDNGTCIGLITDNGITRWLAHHVEEDLISLSESTISEVLELEENTQRFKFMNIHMTVYDAKEVFNTPSDLPLSAILITQNGRAQESLLGIITPWDILQSPD